MTATPSQSLTDLIAPVFQKQQKMAMTLRREPVRCRKEKLLKLRNWIHSNRTAIHQATFSDFKKAPQEVDAIEIFHVLNEIKTAVAHLDDWARPQKVDAPITMLGTRSFIQYEPKGVCLIISPWNYPFSLAVGPLVSAIAAGNTAILKPSELTPSVSALLKKMVSELFSDEEVAVFEGDATIAQHLLRLPFDHIFFTGSPTVGRLIMKAAAENLSSITLELGGKSPCIVTADANVAEAAERIAVAKFVNNGQTCIAPDYVLVDARIERELIKALVEKMNALFVGKGQTFRTSPSYCRIVNDKHFDRLTGLLDDAFERGAKAENPGESEREERFFYPKILSNVPGDALLMEEEIFGPILPVVRFSTLDDAIRVVNTKPKPLALYLFARSSRWQQQVLRETSAGGVCVNDCGIHFLHHNLPFGGVNNSGIGKSHGRYGFLAFSNEKPVLKQKGGMTSVKAFYPPYTTTSKRLMEWFLKLF